MTKKVFDKLTNPADEILNNVETSTTSHASNQVSVKNKTESRSQHVSFLLKPSTANSLKFIAKFNETSVNAIANKLLDEYVNNYKKDPVNAKKLEQAFKLFS